MNKGLIVFIIAVLFVLVAFGYMFYSMEKARQEELNVCAKEYGKKGFERWNIPDKEERDLNYTAKNLNDTHFACCWKKDFIDSTGDMRRLNCTNIHRDSK